MLRYAVALEVLCTSGAILAAASLALRLPSRMAAWGIPICATTLSGLLIGFTHPPEVPRIDYGNSVFHADPIALPEHSLVLLANQPMGLLAPLIQRDNPDASFIGIPSCFEQDGWCRRGFYDYGLGREMRSELATHKGPIFVARYVNANPAHPQLSDFGIDYDLDSCQTMQTNVTTDVQLCRARFDGRQTSATAETYQLRAEIQVVKSGFTLNARWIDNRCSSSSEPGTLQVDWKTDYPTHQVSVDTLTSPSRKRRSFATGGASGSAVTENWVRAGQAFLFSDGQGDPLARIDIQFARCTP